MCQNTIMWVVYLMVKYNFHSTTHNHFSKYAKSNRCLFSLFLALQSGQNECPKNSTTAVSCLVPGMIAAGASFVATTVMGLAIAAFCFIRYRTNKKLDSEMRKTENVWRECVPEVYSERQNRSMGMQMEKKN